MSVRALCVIWRPRPVLVGILAGLGTLVLMGLPAVLLPNQVFSRTVPPTPFDYAFWIVNSLLIGAIVATYVAPHHSPACQTRTNVGGVMNFFAIGCPVCNKVVVLLLGFSGALNYFAALQPVIGAAATALLLLTLRVRLGLVSNDRDHD